MFKDLDLGSCQIWESYLTKNLSHMTVLASYLLPCTALSISKIAIIKITSNSWAEC
jgi:hypothetical protein